MQREDLTRIRHMLEAAEEVERFIDGRSRDDLDQDRMLLFALVRAVEVFGEAASKVSIATRRANGHIPWPAIVAMRNRLAHAYFDIDPVILWRAASMEIPDLTMRLQQMMKSDD